MRKKIREWLGIDEIERDVSKLVEYSSGRMDKIDEVLYARTSGLGEGEMPRQNSTLEYILGAIQAFEKKIGRVGFTWEDDPCVCPPEHPKVRVWKITEPNVETKRKKITKRQFIVKKD